MGPETQEQDQSKEQAQTQVYQEKQVIVDVRGGWVSEITHPADVHVIVRDYDLDGTEAPETIKTDEDGEEYQEECWG